MKKLWLAVVAISIVTLGGVAIAMQPDAPKPQPPAQPHQELIVYTPEQLLEKVNALRAEKGVAPLKLDDRLNRSATLKNADMDEGNYFDHKNPTTGKHGYEYIGETAYGVCRAASENISYNGILFNTPNLNPVDGWKNSPAHYAAEIDPKYDLTGFSARVNEGDFVYYTQHFCDLH